MMQEDELSIDSNCAVTEQHCKQEEEEEDYHRSAAAAAATAAAATAAAAVVDDDNTVHFDKIPVYRKMAKRNCQMPGCTNFGERVSYLHMLRNIRT